MFLVLARLLPPAKRAPTRKAVVRSVASCMNGREAESRAQRALDTAIERKLVDASPLKLNQAGREALRLQLGVPRLPEPRDWSDVRRQLLTSLSLGGATLGKTSKSADALAASILRKAHKLSPDAGSLKSVVDRLAWRALGVDSDAPFDAARVQRHLLRDIVPADARVDASTFRRMLAVRAVGAKRGDAQALRKAALARWLEGEALDQDDTLVKDVAKSDNDNSKRADIDLRALATAVVKAARAPQVVRFHDDRAFIGSVWEHMRGKAPIGSMSLDEFKEQLVAGHRAGLLRMTRADLVGAMDVNEVERSEAKYLGATFHFVALDRAGAR
jgi:hypothetical protein